MIPLKIPPAYHTIPREVLLESQARLESLDLKEWDRWLREEHGARFQKQGADRGEPSFTLRRSGLLGVRNACLWAACAKQETEAEPGVEPQDGYATLLDRSGAYIPLFVTFGTPLLETVRHEKIHLCQILHPDPAPLNAEDVRWLYSGKEIYKEITSNPESPEFFELFVRILCSRWFRELEASHFCSQEMNSIGDFLHPAASSVLFSFPITVAECAELRDDQAQIDQRVDEYLSEASRHHPWLADILVRCYGDSFMERVHRIFLADAEYAEAAANPSPFKSHPPAIQTWFDFAHYYHCGFLRKKSHPQNLPQTCKL